MTDDLGRVPKGWYADREPTDDDVLGADPIVYQGGLTGREALEAEGYDLSPGAPSIVEQYDERQRARGGRPLGPLPPYVPD